VTVRAVVFDVGETLVDETRVWSDWADWLGIPRLTFMAVLGALIERGGDHLDPLRLFVPGIDIKAEFAKRADAGVPDDLRVDDLYPDAVPALRALIAAGYRVGIVGNQPTRVATELGLPPGEIAYVGDRLDNDVRPAAAAGMVAIFIRRGAWGWIQAGRSDPPEAAATIESLSELPGVLAAPGSPR